MTDLTILYLTVNNLPQKWADFQVKNLLESAKDFPIVSISRNPMDIGTNVIQTPPFSYVNIYTQILNASKMVDTEYVAIAEDDCLYSKEHFTEYRPARDAVAYNMARWSVFTWGEPLFSLRRRLGNFAMIGSREYVIDALEERFAKWGNNWPENGMGEIGRTTVEKTLGVSRRNVEEFYSSTPIINVSHQYGLAGIDRRQNKRHAEIRAVEIPNWGRAETYQQFFKV